MAARAEESGVRRASMDPLTLFVLECAGRRVHLVRRDLCDHGERGKHRHHGAGRCDGAYRPDLPYGITRLLTGLVFSVGLILVVVGGAELFTGNNLIVMAWASGKVKTRAVLLNWVVAFIGNFVGAIGDRRPDVPARRNTHSAAAPSDWWR